MVKWSKEVQDKISTYQASDFDIKDETPAYILMEKKTSTLLGHILIFVFFGWWTFGIANLIYWAVAKKKRKIIK